MVEELSPAAVRKRFDWGRLITGFVVIACLSGMLYAFTLNETPEPDEGLPAAIERVDPAPNSPVVPSQSTISVDLAFGFESVLLLNGVELPLDQLDRGVAQAILRWTPGRDQEFRRLPAGRQCAGVEYWPQSGTQAKDGLSYEWCFNVN